MSHEGLHQGGCQVQTIGHPEHAIQVQRSPACLHLHRGRLGLVGLVDKEMIPRHQEMIPRPDAHLKSTPHPIMDLMSIA